MISEYKNVDLCRRNSFAVSAIADRLIEFDTVESLHEIFASGLLSGGKWAVLSGGNNVLLTGDYRGTLIHPTMRVVEQTSSCTEWVCVRAEAGVEWDDLVAWCVDRGLWGVENLSLIPGYVGAAPVQNIGAYGVELKDVVESVEMYNVENGNMVTIAADHCMFGYRDSVFKRMLKGRVVITAVNFRLSTVAAPKLGYGDLKRAVEELEGETLENIRRAVIDIRRSKLPDTKEIGNAGSFFKNPVVTTLLAESLREQYADIPIYPAAGDGCKLAAGWLIDRAGWRGFRRGAVGVHKSQALVLVNYGGGTGEQILSLADDIKADINKKFGVDIEMEVNVW